MIKFDKRPNPPDVLSEKKVTDTIVLLRDKVAKKIKPTSSKPNDFPSYWLPEARKKLWEHQNKKCCFCERIRGEKYESDLEHFRPKAEVTEEQTHFGYWWLAYEWENYMYSCKSCNQKFKKSQFPLLNTGIRAFNEGEDLKLELPILINPYEEDPELLISFDWDNVNDLFVKAVSNPQYDNEGKGQGTIKIVGLNSTELLEGRAGYLLSLRALAAKMMAAEHLLKDQATIDKIAKEIKEETSAKKAYAGFRRAFFRKMGLENYINND